MSSVKINTNKLITKAMMREARTLAQREANYELGRLASKVAKEYIKENKEEISKALQEAVKEELENNTGVLAKDFVKELLRLY